MGGLEILVIMLVAFIVLGPQRMVDAARFVGKAVREVRRMTAGMQEIVMDDGYGDLTPSTGETRAGRESKRATGDERRTPEPSDSDDGPVAHRPSPGAVAGPEPDGEEGSGRDET
jgi:Sec-independent protein translocase protein TatA